MWAYVRLFAGTRAEVELGRILTRRGWKRTCYIVTTKIYWSTRYDSNCSYITFWNFHDCRSEERGLSRKHIIESIKASLVRLQLSYIDVVIVHKADPMCPMEGTAYFGKLIPPDQKIKINTLVSRLRGTFRFWQKSTYVIEVLVLSVRFFSKIQETS